MKEFKDLVFKEHYMVASAKEAIEAGVNMEECLGAKHAKIEFKNGIKLSVVFGSVFYSNGVDTYECMVVKGSVKENEPRGDLTEDEVTEYMKELQEGN